MTSGRWNQKQKVSEPGSCRETAWLKGSTPTGRLKHWGGGDTSQYMQTDLGFSSSFTIFEFDNYGQILFSNIQFKLSIQNSMNKCRIFAIRGK